jgi:protein-disulfide isomerase
VDTGKVRYVFRELLTDPVPFAGTAFMMARCAGESKYFDVLNDVFQQQTAIYQSGDLSAGLLKIGLKYGMDKDKLNACMDEKAVDALNARVEKANKDGVDSTPTFIIAGNKSVGEKSLEDLSAAIDPLLAK